MGRAQQQPSGMPAKLNRRRANWLPPGVRAPELTIPGVSTAASRIAQAVRSGDCIAAFCDYDPDGTSASECLRMALAPHVAGISYSPGQPGQLLFGYATATKGFG